MDKPFREEDYSVAKELYEASRFAGVIFSEGTYQVEIVDSGVNESYWIFLQLGKQNRLVDYFCTCKKAEEFGSCPHLAAAHQRIFSDKREPLHVRFQTSLWNRLCRLASRLYGYDASVLHQKSGSEFSCGNENEELFSVRVTDDLAQKRLNEIFLEREEETEETSLKFSNLDPQELTNWRRGEPSHALRYELSFWADLAKWLVCLEDVEGKAKIDFQWPNGDENNLPKTITAKFASVDLRFAMAQNDWPKIIPALIFYPSKISVFEFKDMVIDKITYDEDTAEMVIDSKPIERTKLGDLKEEYQWENWVFIPKAGFFPKQTDPLLLEKKLSTAQVGELLKKYPRLVERYLQGTKIDRNPITARYHLFFDADKNLHISCYAFAPFDLDEKKSRFFDPWVFVPKKGLFRLEKMLFQGTEKIIPKEKISEFVDRNRLWLSNYDGFQCHLTSVESRMCYHLEDDGIHFENEGLLSEDQANDIMDFGQWIYIHESGFFSKGSLQGNREIEGGLVVAKEHISPFIHGHKEELEQVKGFFTTHQIVQKTGLDISLSQSGEIVVEPSFFFTKEGQALHPKVYGDFVYLEGEGFNELLDSHKLPEKYFHKRIIPKEQQAYFIKHELKKLRPYALHIDAMLVEPKHLQLKLKRINVSDEQGQWIAEFVLESESGSVNLRNVLDAMLSFQPHLLCEAGMISLKDSRFHWLQKLSPEEFSEDGNRLTLSTLDWIRLSLFEEIEVCKDIPKEEAKLFTGLNSLQGLHLEEMPNLKGLKSELRSYQQIGIRWLWFLYTYGLSGFLCDEMGLGKTHQAMALLVAVKNYRKRVRTRFLVVCPTSVIYHWQGILEKFWKKAVVKIYHGPFRNPKSLKTGYDVLLTSYGILRSDKEYFAKLKFEVIVMDEIHVAKNQRAQIHRALRLLNANMRLGLTGTPIENHILDIKSLFDIVLPRFLPSDAQFKEQFIAPVEKGQDSIKESKLSALINPFILRRKKQEVLDDLPEKIEEISYIALSDEQKELYDNAFISSKNQLEEESHESSGTFYLHVFALLGKLKQICNHPALVRDDVENYHKYKSGKWDLFVELLDETRASAQKLVVFTQYLNMMTIIESHLKSQGIGYASIRGSTKDRRGEVDRFREDPNCEVFVGSLQAAGVGIDLVSASVVIHYDRWWNPAKENQATDRVHRIGQNRGVSVFKLVTKGTIEEHIHHLIEKKMDLIQSVIGYDTHEELKKIDREELVELLNLIEKDVEAS